MTWKDIHQDFTPELQTEWINNRFTYEQTKEWVNTLGEKFDVYSYDFYVWLRDEKGINPKELTDYDIEGLNDYFAADFDFYNRFDTESIKTGRYYFQKWEIERGLTSSFFQAWAQAGFKLDDYDKAKEWKDHNFTPQQVKSWKDIGLDDIDFVAYLREKDYEPNMPNIKEIIKEEAWQDIHQGFNYQLRKAWEKAGINHTETKKWISIGLDENDVEFTSYLKGKDYQPGPDLDLEQLREKLTIPQNYLNAIYPHNQRNTVQRLNLYQKNLSGNLDLTDFINLEALDCRDNQLNFLNLVNCRKLKKLDCENNQLTYLDLSNLNELSEIYCHDNNLKIIKFPSRIEQINALNISNNNFLSQNLSLLRGMINLEGLFIGNTNHDNYDQAKINQGVYNHFHGSLEPLQNLTKLEYLSINNTNIDSGLEYLPSSVKYFYCSAGLRTDAKCQTIYNLFANEQGEVEKSSWGIKKFFQGIRNYKQWRKLNFSEEEIKQWINGGFMLNNYETANQFKQKGYHQNIPIKEIIKKESWRDIHPNFRYSIRREWENKNFSKEKTKEWMIVGAKVDDHGFVTWLRDIKKETPEWVTNYQEDYQELSERFKKYGLCSECNQPNTGEQWCQPCNAPRLQENFSNWTSSNLKIDEFVKKYQLQATDADKFLEWIPYEQFSNIEYLARGGFGKVYKARWLKGNIHHWDIENNQWHRELDCYNEHEQYLKNFQADNWIELNQDKHKKYKDYREVVLKSLTNSQGNTDFLDETAKHKIIDDWFNNIVPCYGLSQNPETRDYLMVMQYMPEGNLRHYLNNKNKESTFKDKLSQLHNIAQGLKDIHQKGLAHRDLHSGNILKGVEKTECLIADLGLCKPADEINKKDKIYGILPYVAPEVLRSQPYSQKSDIYSFGIIAYEILSGLPPYYDVSHDIELALKICQGLRPQFKIKISQLLKDLIEQCWDVDPQKRPTANDLERTLRSWEQEISNRYDNTEWYDNTEFARQLQEAEEFNKNLPDEVKFPKYEIHHGAFYHSKLLPTKEITQLLQNSQKTNDQLCSPNDNILINTALLDSIKKKQASTGISKESNQLKIENNNNKKITSGSTGLTTKIKRQLSFSESDREAKSIKLDRIETMEVNNIDREHYSSDDKINFTKFNKVQGTNSSLVNNGEEENMLKQKIQLLQEDFDRIDTELNEDQKKDKQLIEQINNPKTILITGEIELKNLESRVGNKELVEDYFFASDELNNRQKETKPEFIKYYKEKLETSEKKIAEKLSKEEIIKLKQLWKETKYSKEQLSQISLSNWQNHNFTYQQTQQWIQAGLQPDDANFAAWLRDEKSQDIDNFAEPQWVKANADINELRQTYQQETINNKMEIDKNNQQTAQILQTNLPKGGNN